MVGTGNTFNWFGTYDAGKVPLRIEGVQTINYALATDQVLDWSSITKAANGVELFRILNATALSGKTITTSAGQTVSLATGNGNVGTAGVVTWAASATDTTANLILAGYQGATGATPLALTITGAATTTLNLASSTAANAVSDLTAPGTATTLNITGSTNLKTAKTIGTVLATINAATATGSISLNVNDTAANLSFIGGSGSDTITFGATNTFTTADNVDGGTGSNTLGMNKEQAVGLTKAYTNIKNFSTLSINNATADKDIIDLDYFGGISNVTFVAAAKATTTVSNASSNATVKVGDSSGIAVTLKADSGADVLNFGLSGTSKTATLNASGFETLNLDVSGAATAATFAITDPQLTNLRLSNLSSSAVRSDVSVNLGSLGTVVRSVDLSGHDAATATNGVALVLNNAAVFGASVIGSVDNDLINGSGQGDTISSGSGIDIIYGDNGGTKALIHSTDVTYEAGVNLSVKILGINTAVTQADNAKLSIIALADKVNADVNLNKLVSAAIGGADKQLVVTFLVDGANTATVTAKAAAQTPTVTTAGTVGNIGKDIIDGGAGNDFIVGNGGADIITTGAGDDTVVLYARTQSNTSTASSWTTVTDFRASGTDKLLLSAVVNGTAAITTTTIASAASLSAFITNAFSGNGATNSIIQAAYFGGDTFIAVDNSDGAFSETVDMIIKLTGTSNTALTTDMFIVA